MDYDNIFFEKDQSPLLKVIEDDGINSNEEGDNNNKLCIDDLINYEECMIWKSCILKNKKNDNDNGDDNYKYVTPLFIYKKKKMNAQLASLIIKTDRFYDKGINIYSRCNNNICVNQYHIGISTREKNINKNKRKREEEKEEKNNKQRKKRIKISKLGKIDKANISIT